jgi:hypothetical protein
MDEYGRLALGLFRPLVAWFEFAASLNRTVDDDVHEMKQDCSLK